jgi:transcriptional regulator with XRE-family HTH domain
MANELKTLGENLKNARQMSKFSLREVEELTGISNAYLSQVENDKIKKPSANILYKLATLYGFDFELLLEVAGIVNRKSNENNAKTLSGSALYSKNLSAEEEEKISEYLAFLRSHSITKK